MVEKLRAPTHSLNHDPLASAGKTMRVLSDMISDMIILCPRARAKLVNLIPYHFWYHFWYDTLVLYVVRTLFCWRYSAHLLRHRCTNIARTYYGTGAPTRRDSVMSVTNKWCTCDIIFVHCDSLKKSLREALQRLLGEEENILLFFYSQ